MLLTLLSRLADVWHPLDSLVRAGGVATIFYAIWYLYVSMRRYYGQGRALTLLKFTLIACSYFVCLLLTLIGTALLSALES